jgi:hypothetical protein
MTTMTGPDGEEFIRRRKARNRAMLVVLLGLCVLFYVMTIARMGGN